MKTSTLGGAFTAAVARRILRAGDVIHGRAQNYLTGSVAIVKAEILQPTPTFVTVWEA